VVRFKLKPPSSPGEDKSPIVNEKEVNWIPELLQYERMDSSTLLPTLNAVKPFIFIEQEAMWNTDNVKMRASFIIAPPLTLVPIGHKAG
jgi:hypothetical protein